MTITKNGSSMLLTRMYTSPSWTATFKEGSVKMIIVIAVLIAVVMLVIFTLALFRMAGRRSGWEQMLEDEDQRKYLESWVRKQESVNVNKAPGCDIGHNAETVKKISEKANRAWTFRENRALWNMRRREPAQRKSARRQKGDQHGLQDSGG